MDPRLQAGVVRAIYDGQPQPTFTCSTSNCTWDPVATLGVCNECADVTNRVIVNCSPSGPRVPGDDCVYEFPFGSSASQSLMAGFYFVVDGFTKPTRWNASSYVPIRTDVATNAMSAILSRTAALQLPPKLGNQTSKARAYDCDFRLCVKTYQNFTVINGVAQVGVVTEDTLLQGGSYFDNKLGLSLQKLVQNSNRNGRSGANAATYLITTSDLASIQHYLNELLSSGWYEDGPATQLNPQVNGSASNSPDIGREMSNAADIPNAFHNIAEAMTEVMRTSRNSTQQPGHAFVQKTIISIQWAWLAYPIALMLMSMALHLIVVLESRRRGLPAWRNSRLALLFMRVEDLTSPEERAAAARDAWHKPQNLTKLARGVRVRISRGKRGERVFLKEE